MPVQPIIGLEVSLRECSEGQWLPARYWFIDRIKVLDRPVVCSATNPGEVILSLFLACHLGIGGASAERQSLAPMGADHSPLRNKEHQHHDPPLPPTSRLLMDSSVGIGPRFCALLDAKQEGRSSTSHTHTNVRSCQQNGGPATTCEGCTWEQMLHVLLVS